MKKRLIDFLAYLKIGQNNFEKKVGLSIGFINKCTGNMQMSSLYKIEAAYPELNMEWLKTGKGEMLNKSAAVESEQKEAYRLVPLKNLDAVGGMSKGNESSIDDPQYTVGMIPFTDAKEGDICIPVTGDSMIPTCPPGSIVLLRKVEMWRDYFGYGSIFVLILNDGRRILKEVNKCVENPSENVLCVSHNKNVPDEPLPKSLIIGVWKVIKILTDKGY